MLKIIILQIAKNMRNITAAIFIGLILCACGGGSSPESTIVVPAPVPAPEVPDMGVAVIVSATSEYASSNHQCNARTTLQTGLQFSEISQQAGIQYQHSNPAGDGIGDMSGGVGAGDFDGDGWVDLYAVGGDAQANVLLRNMGNGRFEEVAALAGIDLKNKGSGPSFADINGDGLLDIFVGGVTDSNPALFINQGNESFLDVIASSGLSFPDNTFSATWGDYDKDNDLDLVVTHWTNTDHDYYAYFWLNNGDMTFTDATVTVGMAAPKGTFPAQGDRTFTPSFADINNDGWQDLLFVVDGGFTKVF
jgi:hypothetical protein